MRIVWHGHSCFEMDNGDLVVVTDPHDGKSIGIKPPDVSADVVLVSHNHFDHNATRMVVNDNSRVVTDRDSANKVPELNITIIPAKHDDVNGAKRGDINMYLFTISGINFCHLGDLGHRLDENTHALFDRPVDILFIPIGGRFTIDSRDALDVVSTLKPKVAIPMHYKISGLTLPIDGPENFINAFKDVNRIGSEIDFSPDELKDIEDTEVWLFSL